MKLYLCGIKSYQLDLGIECTAFSDPRLERTLQGIKRDHNEPQRRERTPLTRPLLIQITSRRENTSYNNTVMQAAFTLAFAAFLRIGKFTYKQVDFELGGMFRNWFLTKSSINIDQGGAHMELTLPASKTDPFRHGIQLVISSTEHAGCPVAAMLQLIRIDSHRSPFAPLFCVGQLEQQPFTREYVVQTLRELAIQNGLGQGA